MIIISVITIGYFAFAVYLAKLNIQEYEGRYNAEVCALEDAYQRLKRQKESLGANKSEVEEEAQEIFTLYEIAKNIVMTVRGEDAVEMLKQKLKENVSFEECELLDPLSRTAEQLKKDKEHFLFTLRDQKRKLGVLAFKGLRDQDKEKVMIIGHQFALALRRIKLYQEVEKLAITDSLTGAHTRRYFLERFEEELKRSRIRNIHLSFLMIDVDKFKNFNDKYGHLTGDKILQRIGSVIKENIREIDILARYGGEEFCVVLPETDRASAYYVAERIRSTTEKTKIKAYDAQVQVTVSLGIATFPDDAKSMKGLIDKSDWALYKAKKSGRNQVCVFGLEED